MVEVPGSSPVVPTGVLVGVGLCQVPNDVSKCGVKGLVIDTGYGLVVVQVSGEVGVAERIHSLSAVAQVCRCATEIENR